MNKTILPKLPTGQWVNTADIWGNNYFMMSIVDVFVNAYHNLGFGDNIRHYVSSMDNGYTPMFFLRQEFDKNSEYLVNKIISKPDWASNINKKVIKAGHKFFRLSEEMLKTDFSRLTNQAILKLYKAVQRQQWISHLYGSSITWMADAEKERFTHRVLEIIADRIIKKNLPLSTPEVFSTLTTPLRNGFMEIEENDFWKTAQLIFKNKKLKHLFKNKTSIIKKKLVKFPKENKLIHNYYQKWCWTPFIYEGPAYSIDYYLTRWRALSKTQASPARLIQQRKKEKIKIAKKQSQLMAQLKFSPKEKKIINIAKEAVWVKGFRKDVLYHGMYCYVPMLKEIARRNSLTLKQVRNLCQWEIHQILRGKKFDHKELDQRHRFSLMYVTRGKFQIFLGDEARRFLAKMKIEKIEIRGVSEIKGTCACPGQVKGIVKIVNTQADNKKVKKGDILVSHTTGPDLLPAMKKAAAFVTEAGGLTCHAAIVARELNTPCVVGTLIATKVLKDGDLVEVDATKGLVRKI